MPYSIPFARSERFQKLFYFVLFKQLLIRLLSTNSISLDCMVDSGTPFMHFCSLVFYSIYDAIDMM